MIDPTGTKKRKLVRAGVDAKLEKQAGHAHFQTRSCKRVMFTDERRQ